MPDAPAALQTVEGLADAVTQNRTALDGADRDAQLRQLHLHAHGERVDPDDGRRRARSGSTAQLLREFGLSALMHDIGKVRTPKEILNKPDKLTDEEFAIMRRHVVDGAEILRRTPEMPILAPVVAFEHHLRLDGSGYPVHASSATALNLGSMLCAIADVYDAMRSQRAYQKAFPDRSHPRRPEAQRGGAARSEPGPPLHAAPGDLPAGQSRPASAPARSPSSSRSTRPTCTGRACA